MIYNLYKWSLVSNSRNKEVCLKGYRQGEMKPIISEPLTNVNGLVVSTLKNSYNLKDIDSDYYEWIIDSGFPFDPLNPLKGH